MSLEEKQLKKYDNDFDDLVTKNEMNINNLENLMLETVDNFKSPLIKHTEELLLKTIDEKDLISKKKITGMIKELRLRIKAPKH